MSVSTPRHVSPQRAKSLREHLRTLGYRFTAVRARLQLPHYAQWAPDDSGQIRPALEPYAPRLYAYLQEPEPRDDLDVVIRLLLLNVPTPLPAVRRVFPGELLEDLEKTGLVRVDAQAGLACSDLALWEIDDLFIATDALQVDDPAINKVMPLLPECYEFAQSRLRGEHVLDLCTGSGVHALLASRHAREVVGVDINPRAIAFARFNQALNGIQNARFHEGNLYAPLPAGTRFDLILANPPYSPATDTAPGANFYAGGQRGDEITGHILAGLAERLTAGGTCQIITLLTHWKDEPLEARIRRFLGDEGPRYNLLFTANPLPFESVLGYLDGLIDLDFIRRTVNRVDYGMFHLRRQAGGAPGCALSVPFRPGASPGVEAMLAALGGPGSVDERRARAERLVQSGTPPSP